MGFAPVSMLSSFPDPQWVDPEERSNRCARTLWRTWWPASLALALVARRTRPALLAALVVPAVLDRRERRPDLDLPRYVALSIADDVAYGTGVWLGCLRRRDLGALLPRFTGPIQPPTNPAGAPEGS